ncbi:hypothetical protein I551_1972 [Mycobacterium ulcerans str. Harvey]|uniref:Type VII secretion system protein EccE domain-containing protein n=1 Tax=Mycobacterium ulcerans str. Harvey TaxID=1299332 RepID=A0ABN0R3X2_MYCUL|nr:hypothetical protein I551_1972 [Mycobacterium ulcerans str. Harvey]
MTLRIGPPASDIDVLPLPVIARYLNCYGIRVDAIRITGRTTGSGETQTWIGLTVSAATNLAALQARAARIPLHETARVTARRLADHLREIGWRSAWSRPRTCRRCWIPTPITLSARPGGACSTATRSIWPHIG